MKRFISKMTADDEPGAHPNSIEPAEPMYELPIDGYASKAGSDDKSKDLDADLDAKLDGRQRATSVTVYDAELGDADEADEDKKVVKDAADIANVIIEWVCRPAWGATSDWKDVPVRSDRDDPTMPALTFRTFFLGSGLAAFGSVLAEIYYFKVGARAQFAHEAAYSDGASLGSRKARPYRSSSS